MSDISISRRKFVTSSALTLGGLIAMPLFGKAVSAGSTVQIGVIGTGKRGLGLINTIEQIPGLKVVACCDIIPENLSAAMAKAGTKAKSYTDYEKVLSDKSVDAVIIATPLYLHYPMAMAALDAKKHVYVEKSMAFTIQQSLDLVRKVRSSKQVFQVGFQYRNFAMYHKIREAIEEGWLGKSLSFECKYNRNTDWRLPVEDPELEKVINWRLYKDLCGGPLSELCAHQIDIVNYLSGSHPVKAMGIGAINSVNDTRSTFDNVRTIFEYKNGMKATYTSLLSSAFNEFEIKVIGNNGSIEIGRNKAYVQIGSKKNTLGTVDGVTGATVASASPGKRMEVEYLEPGQKNVEPTIYALNDFLNCVINNNKPASNVETGRDAAIAICMGLHAMETGNSQFWKPEYSI